MRMSMEATAATRVRIIEVASRLFRERGIEPTSIDDVMGAAGLTRGGFYKHFASKDALVAEALRAAFASHTGRFDDRKRNQGVEEARRAYVAEYLSREHVANPGRGCPVAALGAEVSRNSAGASAEIASGVEALIERFVAGSAAGSDTAKARAAAIRQLITMVGAVVVARSVGCGSLSREILTACDQEHHGQSMVLSEPAGNDDHHS